MTDYKLIHLYFWFRFFSSLIIIYWYSCKWIFIL